MAPCDVNAQQSTEQIEWILVDVVGETHTELRYNIDRAMSVVCGTEKTSACVHARLSMFLEQAPEISFQVYFPRWIAPSEASPDAISYWAYTVDRLCKHELGHVDIGIEWRRYVAEELLSEPIPRSLRGSFEYIAMQAYRDAQATYDDVTDRGTRVPPWKPSTVVAKP